MDNLVVQKAIISLRLAGQIIEALRENFLAETLPSLGLSAVSIWF